MSKQAKSTAVTVIVTLALTIIIKAMIKSPKTPMPSEWADYA